MRNSKRLKTIINIIDLNEKDILFHLKLTRFNSTFLKNNTRTRSQRTDVIITEKAIIFVGSSYSLGILSTDIISFIDLNEITCNFRMYFSAEVPFLTFKTNNCNIEILFYRFSFCKKIVRDIFREIFKVLKKNNISLTMNDSTATGNGKKAININAVEVIRMAQAKYHKIPIYTINQSNINDILPQLQVDKEVIDEIIYEVNVENEVTVPETNVNVSGWNGCGYIISDPKTGSKAYMVFGKCRFFIRSIIIISILSIAALLMAFLLYLLLNFMHYLGT